MLHGSANFRYNAYGVGLVCVQFVSRSQQARERSLEHSFLPTIYLKLRNGYSMS